MGKRVASVEILDELARGGGFAYKLRANQAAFAHHQFAIGEAVFFDDLNRGIGREFLPGEAHGGDWAIRAGDTQPFFVDDLCFAILAQVSFRRHGSRILEETWAPSALFSCWFEGLTFIGAAMNSFFENLESPFVSHGGRGSHAWLVFYSCSDVGVVFCGYFRAAA